MFGFLIPYYRFAGLGRGRGTVVGELLFAEPVVSVGVINAVCVPTYEVA
jgi:hypothetical protein